MPPVSPLAPETVPTLPPIAGVRLATLAAGVRYSGRTDVMLMELAPGTSIAGAFTRSLTAAAPVVWCQTHVRRGTARAILVNSGNANAFTGAAGMAGVERTTAAAAEALGCAPDAVFVSSTGVIGEPLPDHKITAALAELVGKLGADAWAEAARAIMTTDTFPKLATRTARIGAATVRLNGIAKGSGMIAPDMATMLAYVATDAAIPPTVLQALLSPAVERSFNCVTVDSDTSTSDTVLAVATGQGPAHPAIADARDPALRGFRRALEDLCRDLALQIVRDGEGATKLVTIDVMGAASARAARRIAFAIANSPLVKTAIPGEDANRGRIVMAVGKAGEKADRDRLGIRIGGVQVAAAGARVEGYDEGPVSAHMKGREIHIEVELGIGRGKARVWTCDLTHGYIDINGSYRS